MDKIVLVLKMEHSNKGDRSNPNVTDVRFLCVCVLNMDRVSSIFLNKNFSE